MRFLARASREDVRSWFSRPVRDAFNQQRTLLFVSSPFLLLTAPLALKHPYLVPAVFGWLLLCTLVGLYRDRRGRRLASAVRRFRTIVSPRFVLHHDPELAPPEAARFVRTCEEELGNLERLFGGRLRAWRLRTGRLRVYLFATVPKVCQVHGSIVGGYAEWMRWAVVLSADHEYWRECVRHELTHMIAGRWNLYAPRLLIEGLAVWAEGHEEDFVDGYAWRVLPDDSDPLALLLNPERIDDPQEFFAVFYSLAGSFTGYLIRRFGWPAYRRFYQKIGARSKTFAARFERHFGVPLTDVSRDWVAELRRIPEPASD